MSNVSFKPYQNESDVLELANLTIENRLDRVCIYGSLDLTKDKRGLDAAYQLKKVIDQAVTALEGATLPDVISVSKSETVENPFE